MGDVLTIDPAQYPGGIALWGALPPVYDTTQMGIERGVHVHARMVAGRKKKEIDSSYSAVRVKAGGQVISISEEAAVAYVAGAILGLSLKYIECPYCKSPHLDLENHALVAHQVHLCVVCKQSFEDTERAIGNPIVLAKQLLNDPTVERPMKRVIRPFNVDQNDPHFSGGIRLWGTHPAILWTAPRDEEEGIHVHAYHAGEGDGAPDETFGAVTIDGIELNARALRAFMVQQQAPVVRGKLARVLCTGCARAIVEDKAPQAITPSTEHVCDCGHVTTTAEPVIANEMPDAFARLYKNAKFANFSKNPSLT